MIKTLRRGANIALTQELPNLRGVVLGVNWDAGAEVALGDNLVLAVLLCNAAGKVLSDDHFVFFNQLQSPDMSVAAMKDAIGDDDEQLEVHLSDVPSGVDRIVAVIYINEGGQQRRTLRQLRRCVLRLLDIANNQEIVRSEDMADGLTTETAVVLAELYRYQSGWKLRVVGQGYEGGLRAVAKDYGVQL